MPRTSKTAQFIGWLVVVLLGIPLLYILSCGPAALLWDKMGWDQSKMGDAIYAFYSPLRPLATSTSAGAKLFRKYIRLWGERIPEPAQTLPPGASPLQSPTTDAN